MDDPHSGTQSRIRLPGTQWWGDEQCCSDRKLSMTGGRHGTRVKHGCRRRGSTCVRLAKGHRYSERLLEFLPSAATFGAELDCGRVTALGDVLTAEAGVEIRDAWPP